MSLTTAWAVDGDRSIFPIAAYTNMFHAEPRLLVVRTAMPIFIVLVIVAHGPHAGSPKGAVQLYWRHTVLKAQSVFRKRR